MMTARSRRRPAALAAAVLALGVAACDESRQQDPAAEAVVVEAQAGAMAEVGEAASEAAMGQSEGDNDGTWDPEAEQAPD